MAQPRMKFPMYFGTSEDGSHVEIACSNLTVCRDKLHISHEDAEEGTIPLDSEWEKRGPYIFCPRCAAEQPRVFFAKKDRRRSRKPSVPVWIKKGK